MTRSRSGTALAGLILSMTIFGTIGLFRRYIPLPSSVLALARGAIGALCLLLLPSREARLPLNRIRGQLPLLALSGGLIGFNWIFLFEAYRYTTVATATLCYYMAPVLVILASPLAFQEPITRRKGLCAAVAVAGMVLVSGVLSSGSSGSDRTGILFGLAAAALYAAVILLNKKLQQVPARPKTLIQLACAALVLLPYTLLTEDLSALTLDAVAVGMTLVVGVVHTGLAYLLYFGAVGKLKAQTTALFSYIDPVVAVLLSALLLQEPMTALQVVGTLLILCSTILSEGGSTKKS